MLAARRHQYISLDRRSIEAISAGPAHAHWLGISQEADAQESIQALSDQSWDWLLVDHYALDARWETALRQTTKNILAIDDLADRGHDCDVLLDQNFYSDMNARYAGRVPMHCRLLLGPRYALLGEEYRQIREQVKPRAGPVKRVLVFFGGVDANNYTGCALEALINLSIEGLDIDAVIGAMHPKRELIEAICAQHQFGCHVQTGRMAELVAAADLAIGAGGSATWERCCLGLPTFSICTAENQARQIAEAASEGLLYAPEIEDDLIHAIKRHLCALLENDYLRRALSRNAMQAVDGRGVLRVIGSLGCSNITIRLASEDDSRKLFEWRNHPKIREVSRNSGVISWEDHQEWFASVLTSPNRLLLVGQRGDVPVGVVRFDIQENEAEVSIYVVPDIEESGLGRDLLQTAERWFAGNRPGVGKVRAHVLGNNARSRRLFLGAGYQLESTCYAKRLRQSD